jgi:pyruvate dehydrogenase E1 component beta subunit
MTRQLSGSEAVKEALDICLSRDKNVTLIGQGVPDGSQTYGTTKDLHSKFGDKQVFDMPLSEASMVGVMLGASLIGSIPVMTFARFEFAMLAMDQIVNQAAKWSYMFDGKAHAPLTLRLIVGRGWGQGAQHSQSLHAWFSHIPGLKVVMPSTPYDLKGLLIASIEDPNPVIFIEHRWTHCNYGNVPEGHYKVPLGVPNLLKSGNKATIVSSSYMTIECLKAVANLNKEGIDVDLIDLRTLSPLDDSVILESVKKTGHLLVCDHASITGGFSGEIITRITEKSFSSLKKAPIRIGLPDIPTPATKALSNYFYPTVKHIENAVKSFLDIPTSDPFDDIKSTDLLDVPDQTFKGPF